MTNLLLGLGAALMAYLWLRSKAKVNRREVELDIELDKAKDKRRNASKKIEVTRAKVRKKMEKYNENLKKLSDIKSSDSSD